MNESAFRRRAMLKRVFGGKEITLFGVLVIVTVLFYLLNSNYLSSNNILSILNRTFVVGTLSVGMACLLISGELDLSAGSTGAMSGVLIAFFMKWGIPWGAALLMVLAFGAIVGAVNAFLVNKLRFVAFISTLAISSVVSGLAYVITNAQTVPIFNKQFIMLGSYTFFGVIPLQFIIMLVLLVSYGVMLAFTRSGRRVYMVGGNVNAARLAGINPKKITTLLFINNSAIAALVGAVFASRMTFGNAAAISGYDLDAITAAVLGGIAFLGGSGNMGGVFLGIMLLTAFQNGLEVAGVDSYYQIIAKGILLIAALTLDFYRSKSNSETVK